MRTTEEANKRNKDKCKGIDNNDNVQVIQCHNDFDDFSNNSDNKFFTDLSNTINLDNIT